MRHRVGSEHTTLRWGDTQTLQVGSLNSGGGVYGGQTVATTKQMLAAKWRWPLVWQLQIILASSFPANEVVTFNVDVAITIGVGQAMMTFHKFYTFAPTGGVYAPFILDALNLPAQDIQVVASVTVLNNFAPANGSSAIQAGFFAAPLTECHALGELVDGMNGENTHEFETMDGRQVSQGMGFVEAPLTYRR